MRKKILSLAIPNVISNITIPLLGMVDMIVLGQLDDVKYLGAVTLGSFIFNFIYWNFAFLRMGSSGLTAQAYGEKNQDKQAALLGRGVFIGVLGGILLIALQMIIAHSAFYLVNGTEEVEAIARNYFYVRIYAAPATLCLYALTGWFIGMQNAIIPMKISIGINIVNIVFNVLFVLYLNMNEVGVALGTVLAQYTGSIIAIILLLKRYKHIVRLINFKKIVEAKELRRFFKVNRDIFIRTFFVTIVMTFFISKSAGYDVYILAINSVLIQYFYMFSFFIDGFAYAGEALTGKYIGAKNQQKLIDSSKSLFKWGIGLGIVVSIVFILLGENLLDLITDDVQVIEGSKEYLWWLKFIPIASMAAFIWDGIYIGATATKEMRNSLLFASFLFFIFFYSLRDSIGNHSLWLAFYAYMFGRGIYQTIFAQKAIYKKYYWQR